MLTIHNNINKFIEIFRKLFAAKNDEEKKAILDLLVSEDEDDLLWNSIVDGLYLLEDTQLAKEEVLVYGLTGATSKHFFGELYLRTYGILSLKKRLNNRLN